MILIYSNFKLCIFIKIFNLYQLHHKKIKEKRKIFSW
jgi:hypothetical protein